MEKKTNYIDTCITLLLVFFMMISSVLPVNGENGEEPDTEGIEDKVSAELVYGADKQDDGSYVWNVPYANDGYQAGHHFVFQISYQTSKEVDADKVHITIPKHIIKNRDGNDSDEIEWSIPSEQDVLNATKTGIPEDRSTCILKTEENNTEPCSYIDKDEIDSDIEFAYREDDNNYIIYNFKHINNSLNGTIDISYTTTENSFAYKDMDSSNFTCNMDVEYVENNEAGVAETVQKKSEINPINVKINTGATVNETYQRYPTEARIKKWDDSWGDEVKPSDVGTEDNPKYYYQIWDIRTDISATQPYDFQIDDTIAGTYTDDNGSHSDAENEDDRKVRVLGYHFSGSDPGYHASNKVENQQLTGWRWDSILVAVPRDPYTDYVSWNIDNKETSIVMPIDNVDPSTNRSSTRKYTWSKPVFHEPGGSFNTFKTGGKWRYDLQNFNGYNGEQTTLDTYDGFDYESLTLGYPYKYTRDDSVITNSDEEPWTAYGQKPVKYEQSDEGVFLLNEDPSPSLNGSVANTIANGRLDKNYAIELTKDDFKIYQLNFSVRLEDAEYESQDKGEFQKKGAQLSDKDILVFEGKFDDGNWIHFATYNLNTQQFIYLDNTYVESESYGSIKFKDTVSMTAYRVSMANAHYYTELKTYPSIALKNSKKVLDHIKNKNKIILLNNNKGVLYQLADGVDYRNQDTDYTNFIKNDDNWKELFVKYNSDSDYARAAQKSSEARKNVVSTSNNTKRKYYTISWKLDAYEQIETSANGARENIEQSSGIFYDLLPAGSTFDSKTVQVVLNDNAYGNKRRVLSDSEYTVKTISNYRKSGRMMLIIQINATAGSYTVTYDTRHSWNSIKDYGASVYNPVAFETGDDSIAGGRPDDGGYLSNKQWMDNLSQETGVTKNKENGNKFIYSENTWDITALTTAAAGLTKKIKAEEDYKYDSSATVHLNGNYSYELRYMNNSTTQSKGIILFDSLENANESSDNASDWKGILQSVDVSQLTKKGINPVIYISTHEKVNPETQYDLADEDVWTKVDQNTDLSAAKAVAIDASKDNDGKDFVLKKGESIAAYLYMRSPASVTENEKEYLYAYNNVFAKNVLVREGNAEGTPFTIRYGNTSAKLIVTGNVRIHKINSDTKNPIRGITFRIFGTSDYGNRYDVKRSSDSNGGITFENVEKGKYTLQEYDATDNYLLDASEHKVRIDATGKVYIDDTDYTDNAIEIENKPRVHSDVKFYKVDSMFTATKLAGAKYRLSGKSDYGTDVLLTEESSSDDLGKVTFKNIEKGTYSLKEIEAPEDHSIDTSEYRVYIDEDANTSIYKIADNDVYEQLKTEVTKYSHTQNIKDDGTTTGSYGNNWNNNNIRGTDRTDASSQAHVVTISGVKSVHVRITWGGESSSYDWVSVWRGSHPFYTASVNYSSGISVAQKLGGGSHTSASNTKEFDVEGDSVTFSYYSDRFGYGDGYGYYAVITGEQTFQGDLLYHKGDLMEIDKDGNDYILKDEPLHYFTFQKLSSYDKSPIKDAEFKLTGVSDNGTSVNTTAASDDNGFVRFEGLEKGTYLLQETKAPEGFEINTGKYIVILEKDGTYTISGGLSKEKNIYTMYDTRIADKKVSVTKVWDDGITNHKPEDLTITITTDVPEKSQRTYSVIYDANGGTFGNE